MTDHTVICRFDEPFLRRALWHDFFWHIVKAEVALGAIALGAWVLKWEALAFWIIGSFVLLFPIILILQLRIVARRTVALWRHQSPSGEIHYTATDAGMEIALDQGGQTYAWAGMRRLWRYDDAWMLEIVRRTSLILPAPEMTDAMKAFIIERCQEHGVRV